MPERQKFIRSEKQGRNNICLQHTAKELRHTMIQVFSTLEMPFHNEDCKMLWGWDAWEQCRGYSYTNNDLHPDHSLEKPHKTTRVWLSSHLLALQSLPLLQTERLISDTQFGWPFSNQNRLTENTPSGISSFSLLKIKNALQKFCIYST